MGLILAIISPGLSWDAMLEMTGTRLGKIVGIGMYLFIEKVTKRRNFVHY